MHRSPLRRAALLLALGGAGLGCTQVELEQLREHTYPPSFNYISAEQMQSTMWQLADHAAKLDRLMRTSGDGDEALRAQVIWRLAEMERVALALGPGDWPSNHPRVSRNVESFRSELESARRAAELDPPSYFLAGSVSGACVQCHADD
jgi:hypothetical protein